MKLPNAQSVTVHEDLAALSDAVAQRIAALAKQSIATRGSFSLALAGGETPRRCYEKMRALPVDWRMCRFILATSVVFRTLMRSATTAWHTMCC